MSNVLPIDNFITSITRLYSENKGDSLFIIKQPSTNIDYEFKPINVSSRKSLAKLSLIENDDDRKIKSKISQISLLKSLCINDSFNESLLTEIDLIYMITVLRSQTIMNELKLNIKCKCNQQFSHTIDFNVIAENCLNKVLPDDEITITPVNDKNIYTISIGQPTLIDVLTLLNGYKNDKDGYIINLPYLYVKSIKINEYEVENFRQQTIDKRFELIDKLNDQVFFNTDNGIYYKILSKYINIDSKIYPDIICPSCKENIGGVITTDNFFTV